MNFPTSLPAERNFADKKFFVSRIPCPLLPKKQKRKEKHFDTEGHRTLTFCRKNTEHILQLQVINLKDSVCKSWRAHTHCGAVQCLHNTAFLWGMRLRHTHAVFHTKPLTAWLCLFVSKSSHRQTTIDNWLAVRWILWVQLLDSCFLCSVEPPESDVSGAYTMRSARQPRRP